MTDPSWPRSRSVLFRALLTYGILYALPFPLQDVAAWDSLFWCGWTSLLGDWMTLPVVHQVTGSGDSMHQYLKAGSILALAFVITVVWSLLDRRPRSYAVASRWLHLGARFYLGFWLIGYGSMKVYAGQFSEPGLSRLTDEFGEASPMGLMWTFMGASRGYEVWTGLAELLAGSLLFHRRSALLGALLSIAVMANVFALNCFYDIPVKLFSLHLLLCAILLLLPFRRQLWALVANRTTEPIELAVTRRRVPGIILSVLGWLWVCGALAVTHMNGVRRLELSSGQGRPALYGVWDVEEMKRDGAVVSPADATRWKFFAIDHGPSLWTRDHLGSSHRFQLTELLERRELLLTGYDQGAATETWSVVVGTKTVRVPDPQPSSLRVRDGLVDADRATLVLEGTLNGVSYQVRAVRRAFELHRGLRWVQEVPYHR